MFQFTIRELLMLTLIVGLGTAWGRDHTALATVRDDAEALARYGDPHRGACGNVAGFWLGIANKYTERTSYEPRLVIQEENEAKLGIYIEQ